jgi:hypothetical protein
LFNLLTAGIKNRHYPALHESWQDFLIFVRGEDFINDDDG